MFFSGSKNLSLEALDSAADEFVALAQALKSEDEPMPKFAKQGYAMSKVFVRSLTEILNEKFPDFYHFSYCPGWCRSDMAGYEATKSAEEGARIAHWLGTSQETRRHRQIRAGAPRQCLAPVPLNLVIFYDGVIFGDLSSICLVVNHECIQCHTKEKR